MTSSFKRQFGRESRWTVILVSRTVKLSGHVGHKVSVTGTVLGEEDEENEGQEEGEGGWIQVTRLKMISETCK
jgi:hypothetical protein